MSPVTIYIFYNINNALLPPVSLLKVLAVPQTMKCPDNFISSLESLLFGIKVSI